MKARDGSPDQLVMGDKGLVRPAAGLSQESRVMDGQPLPQISVAPMMGVTDRHCRFFLRLMAPRIGLYTEMLTAQSLLHGDPERLLGHDLREHPLAVQLAGSEPRELAAAARIAADFSCDEINLNVGCPSDRVQSGRFGACLMLDPQRVADCVAAMAGAVRFPVTVKTRIGVDEHDSYEFLARFVATVAAAGCRTFIVHARKAVLKGLSPRQNRAVPPLRYEIVYRLKQDFPSLRIVINGGISGVDQIQAALRQVDGVMIGRKAVEDPYFLAQVQLRFLSGFGEPVPDRGAVIRQMFEYSQQQMERGVHLHRVTRRMLGLFHGVPGARAWRRFLTERVAGAGARPELLLESVRAVRVQLAA